MTSKISRLVQQLRTDYTLFTGSASVSRRRNFDSPDIVVDVTTSEVADDIETVEDLKELGRRIVLGTGGGGFDRPKNRSSFKLDANIRDDDIFTLTYMVTTVMTIITYF